jgi:HlyD family secretion protein
MFSPSFPVIGKLDIQIPRLHQKIHDTSTAYDLGTAPALLDLQRYRKDLRVTGVKAVDISIATQKNPAWIRYWPWALLCLVVAAAVNYLWFLGQADYVVDSDIVVYAEVKRGKFSVSVRGTGVVVPDNIQWLSSSVEANVERVIVKPGKIVVKGDLIAELANPQLIQQLEETKWELQARTAESIASEAQQQSALLEQKSVMLDAKFNYESSKLKLDAQSILFQQSTGTISKIDYERTRLDTIQLEQRWGIQQELLEKMKENIHAQRNARIARINKMEKTLARAQQQVSDLMVYASIDSVVQDVAIEPGQRISMGGKIAKLARQDSLIVELQVPELQIREVVVGQRVIINTRSNKVQGTVLRVDPAVVNGNVQVDVRFNDDLPREARPDLTVDGEIKIAEIADTLYVNRPIFAQSQSSSAFYKLSRDGNFAERVPVTLGKGSVNRIQIIKGLVAGEKIIISDPSSWETHQKIRIH